MAVPLIPASHGRMVGRRPLFGEATAVRARGEGVGGGRDDNRVRRKRFSAKSWGRKPRR